MENEAVRTVKVSLLKVVVSSFTPNDNRAVLDIFFEDGKSKQMRRSTKLGDANLLSMQLIEELVIKEKNDFAEFDGETLREVEIMIENEQKVRLLLMDFFRTLHSKAQQIRNSMSSSGYLDMLRNFQRTELTLYDK